MMVNSTNCVMFRLIITLALLSVIVDGYLNVRIETLQTVFKWKQMDYVYLNEQTRQEDINNGKFIQQNIMPLCVEKYEDRMFINTPRWKDGIPVTLSTVSTKEKTDSPPLKPYPNWDMHNAGNCTGFTSVFRMAVDPCGVMWVLDSGAVDILNTAAQVCPPTVVAIDLKTDKIVGRYTIPSSLVRQDTLTTNIIVDTKDERCNDMYIYITDSSRNALYVLKVPDGTFWKFNHYTFYPEPLLCNYTIHGVSVQWTDGLLGMSLGRFVNGDRPMYYHAMSSSLEFEVSTKVLQNPANVDNSTYEFKLLGPSRGPRGQVSASVVDRRGVMFYNLVSQDSIGCWDTRKPYKKENLNIVVRNNQTLIFPNDLRIDYETPQNIWIVSNRLPLYQAGVLTPNEYNYRILVLDPIRATENNSCNPKLVV